MRAERFYFPELEEYYNTGPSRKAFITMDVDWAPDTVLEWTFSWFIEHEIAITAFVTHESAVALRYESHPLTEIGIHPDLSRDMKTVRRVEELCRTYRKATGSRSHRNICGRNVTDVLHECGIIYDVSKLLWGISYAECTPLYNGMVEAPYVWEDGVHLEMQLGDDMSSVCLDGPGLKILNIHPVLFYLNCASEEERKAFTSRYTDLTKATLGEFEKARNNGCGIGEFARQIILELKRQGYSFHLLRDLMQKAYQMESNRRERLSR